MKQLGTSTLSIIPVRTEPSDKSELCTQLLFGDEYEVLEISENGKWIKILISFDNYEGWIDIKQHTSIDKLNQDQKYFLSDYTHTLITDDFSFPILMGSNISTNNTFHIGEQKFKQKETLNLSSLHFGYLDLPKVALRYINAPYLWGGKTHFGIDCSGLTQQVFKIVGIKIPRDAYQQENLGKNIPFGEQKAGDLVFFTGESGRVIHVGLMTDSETIIHAHAYVRLDRLTEQGILNLKTNLYSHRLHSIKRMEP
jgi:cell wall-associated NlpC family hydrolase